MKEYWESYKALAAQLYTELPEEVVPFGEFIIKWSPFIVLLIIIAKLIDKLFESPSAKFIVKSFVKICQWMWAEALEEPEHTGIITEAPIPVQRAFHKFCAWVQAFQALILFILTFLAMYPLLTMQIRDDKLFEGAIVLSFLSGMGVFIGLIQVRLCHKSIILARTLNPN
jgi:hypothetical protein